MKLLRGVIYFFLILPHTSCVTNKVELSTERVVFVAPENSSRMRLFDEGWRFSKTESEDAFLPGFDDSSWRKINLPHDWSIEDLPAGEGVIGPFSERSQGGISTGFTVGGTGVYRKKFSVAPADYGKIFTIYFDGVYMESDVWINGHHLGFHPNGYTPFYYKISEYLNAPGKENVLVVKARNIGENSRWYSGSGIYRHIWLRVTDPLNIPFFGISVKTVDLDKNSAKIDVKTSIQNQGNEEEAFVFRQEVVDAEGITLAELQREISSDDKNLAIQRSFEIKKPIPWSPDQPKLYMLKTEILQDDSIVDVVETRFGIRTMDFSPDKGFLLNGEPMILKGACLHHDNGILGAATYDRAEQRKIELMKANGFNAIRTSHNPPSQQFLDACDSIGMLVLDEAFDRWEHPKKPNDYHRYFKEWSKKDIQSMVMRDRNHPSVFAWSYGNEIHERADSSGIHMAKNLISAIKEIDTTRPVTQAICGFWDFPDNRPWSDTEPAFELMDIHGYNYKLQEYESDHDSYPDRIIIGTESFPMEMYDNYKMAIEKPYVIGDFVWTGMDYLGEAGLGQPSLDSIQMEYPWFNAYCGDIDLIGRKKPQSYYRDVVWGRSKLEIAVEEPSPEGHSWKISKWGWRNELPSWNWEGYEGKSLNIYVYSQADRIDLFLNGDLCASQLKTDTSKCIFQFEVPYKSGELKVIAYVEGDILNEKSIRTTGPATKIKIKPDREIITRNINDLVFMEVSLMDNDDQLVMTNDRLIHFEVKGAATTAAVGNGNPTQMKSFQADSCMTYRGKCLLVLRPLGYEGTVTVNAKSNLLEDFDIQIAIK